MNQQNVSMVVVEKYTGSKFNRFLQFFGLRDKEVTLHAIWAEKNTEYPNSFNVNYNKSEDKGDSWGITQKIYTK